MGIYSQSRSQRMFEEHVVRYAPSTGSTTSAPSRGSIGRRIRVVRLLRPKSRQMANARAVPSNFGFSLRGGSEHGTGFFISHVEPETEAYFQGLKSGDQVMAVNGFRVDDAVHSELAHYISTQNRVKLKVRNVGVIPVKEKVHEPLSWKYISENSSMISSASSSPTSCERIQEVQMSLLVPPRARLGLGICKGPEWKPGIFVQFIKEQGIARDAGLRAGDQITACNGVEFRDITFNEAVSIMKQSGRLVLRVRPGAGPELVSGESSGYNSSASSEHAGGGAPPGRQRHRQHNTLAALNEEHVDRYSGNLKRRTWNSVDFDFKPPSGPPSDIEPDYDTSSNPEMHTFQTFKSNPANRTVINLTENGATIECSYDGRRTVETKAFKEATPKRIIVEVHKEHSGNDDDKKENDQMSLSSSNTLSSAIADEIKRRKKKKDEDRSEGSPTEPQVTPKRKIVLKPIDDSKKKQHDALMDEFKKMHRKMFKQEQEDGDDADTDRQATIQQKQQQMKQENKVNGVAVKSEDKSVGRVNGTSSSSTNGSAPPPPPMPAKENGVTSAKTNGIDTNPIMNGINKQNGTFKIPPPDYDDVVTKTSQLKLNGSPNRNTVITNGKSNGVEKKFFRAQSETAIQKNGKPSVTIGEYPSNTLRKNPAKLEFLNGEQNGNHDETDGSPISSRLQSELALTLSRSNLKKRTEAMEKKDLANGVHKSTNGDLIDECDQDKNFHLRYGNNILPTPPKITIPKVAAKDTVPKIDPFKCESFPHEGSVKEKTLFLNGAGMLTSKFQASQLTVTADAAQ